MKRIATHPKLAEQVEKAILSDIISGRLPAGSRVVQEHIAKNLGVSRQPVQQALHILRSQGILRDAAGRGMEVVPLDLEYVRNVYDIRAVIEGLASREAALRHPEKAMEIGKEIMAKGRDAVRRGAYEEMIANDMAFHNMIYGLAENPLIPAVMERHWTTTQRVMGEVLHSDDKPRDIWNQHEEILLAISAGDGDKAEYLARKHISRTANYMIERLKANQAQSKGKPTSPDEMSHSRQHFGQ